MDKFLNRGSKVETVILDESKSIKPVPARSASDIFRSFKERDKAKEQEIERQREIERERELEKTRQTEQDFAASNENIQFIESKAKQEKVDIIEIHEPGLKSVSIGSLLTGTKKKKQLAEDDEAPIEIISSSLLPKPSKEVVEIVDIDGAEEEESDIPIITSVTAIPKVRRMLLSNGKFNALAQKKKSDTFMVTLKVRHDKLRSILEQKRDTEKINESNDVVVANNESPKRKMSMSSFFAEVSQKAKKHSLLQEHSILDKDQLKHMDLPTLKFNEFLVQDMSEPSLFIHTHQEPLFHENSAHQKFDIPSFLKTIDFLPYLNELRQYSNLQKMEHRKYDTRVIYQSPVDVATSRHKCMSDPRFKRIFDEVPKFRNDRSSQWCDLFRPLSHKHILQSVSFSNKLDTWLNEAFALLKSVDRAKRAEQLKKKRKKASDASRLDDFIDYDDEEEVYEHTFVPSLILEGPTGSGKTSSIYATVKEYLDGHIFELNSSQNRAKKSINFHLKQIGTTFRVKDHLVDNTDVILFEDIDLIDEEDDKEFWSSALELLSCSYRPIIFTTTDVSLIPENIVEESTVLIAKHIKKSILSAYLDVVALCMGYSIENSLLKEVCTRDIRSSLLNLQMFCYQFGAVPEGILEINEQKETTQTDVKKLDTDTVKDRDIDKKHQPDSLSEVLQSHESLENLLKTYHNRVYDESAQVVDVRLQQKTTNAVERYSFIEFYASKLYSIGSRKRQPKYRDAFELIFEQPTCQLNNTPDAIFFSEISPFIKEMARIEKLRVDNGLETIRKFDVSPYDIIQKN